MPGETRRVYGAQFTLEANGASIASGAVGVADDLVPYTSTNTGDFPDAVFSLTCAFGGTPQAGTVISLFIRPHNIDGAADQPAPSATYQHMLVGSFMHDGTSASQTLYCEARDLPKEGQAYLLNNTTGQTLSAGWVLKATPLSYMPAA